MAKGTFTAAQVAEALMKQYGMPKAKAISAARQVARSNHAAGGALDWSSGAQGLFQTLPAGVSSNHAGTGCGLFPPPLDEREGRATLARRTWEEPRPVAAMTLRFSGAKMAKAMAGIGEAMAGLSEACAKAGTNMATAINSSFRTVQQSAKLRSSIQATRVHYDERSGP